MKIGLHNNSVEVIEHYRELDHAEALFRQLVEPSQQSEICRHFGCGRTLTLEERLHGNKCRDHSIEKNVDVTNFISY